MLLNSSADSDQQIIITVVACENCYSCSDFQLSSTARGLYTSAPSKRDRRTDRQTDRDRQADRQAGRQAGRQTGRQADRQTSRENQKPMAKNGNCIFESEPDIVTM